MKYLDSTNSNDLDTRVFLPNWWVHSYGFAISTNGNLEEGFKKLQKSGLAPQFNVIELNALAQIISYIQKKLLETNNIKFQISPSEMAFEFQGGSNLKMAAFESAISRLGGVRLAEEDEEAKSISFKPLFKNEFWEIKDSGEILNLELEKYSEDKIFGFQDPYFFWTYADQSEESIRKKKNVNPPISLWKSIWLDLTGLEQALLIRLEKKMQWTDDWLHLEGVFELDWDSFFKDLKLPTLKAKTPVFVKKIQVLEKLGKKLIEHGFLSPEIHPQYLAFNNDEGSRGLNLTWQIASDRLLGDEFWQNVAQVSSYYTKRSLGKLQMEWLNWLSPGLPQDVVAKIQLKLLPPLRKALESIDVDQKHVVLLEKNNIISLYQLFVEWHVRQQTGHKFPLPEEMRSSEAAKLSSLESDLSVDEALSLFLEEISDNPSYIDALKSHPFVTLASEVSCFQIDLLSWAKKYKDIQHSKLGDKTEKELKLKPQLVFSKKPETVRKEGRKESETMVATRYAKSQMRKIAASELSRIKRESSEDYKELNKIFFDSLDSGQKKIILGVQKKMAPTNFEIHLKKQLLEFMVKNPSSWSFQNMKAKKQAENSLETH